MRQIKILFIFLFLQISLLGLATENIAKSENNVTSEVNPSSIEVFGSHLFNGNFQKFTHHIYNPEYKIAIGDVVSLKIWGAIEFEQKLTVDSQGNIFVPRVGAIQVLGVKNSELVDIIKSNVNKVYKDNVYVYADMNAYQNVSIFVTGNVNKPGLYQGLSSDSIIQYLDKAKGINLEYGSFRNITVLRDNRVFKQIDLYDFLLNGSLEIFAFRAGDVVHVGNLENYIFVEGSVLRPARFELKKSSVTIDEILSQAIVDKQSTNFLVSRFDGKNNYISSIHSIKELDLELSSGDKIEFLKDSIARNVTVKIEGEHQNLHSMVVEKGTTLKSILEKINYSFLSQKNAIQLFRKSVAQKQKMLIEAQLKDIEAGALTTGSDTSEEAVIRAQESKLILEFVERARKVEPKGQVILNAGSDLSKIILEEGDTIYIPSVSHTVSIQGEVLLPGAQSFVEKLSLNDYVEVSGGYTNRANLENVLLIKQNGAVEKYNADSSFAKAPVVEPGDSILVLGEVDSKNLQIAKDVTQILYQIAVGAAVVLRAF